MEIFAPMIAGALLLAGIVGVILVDSLVMNATNSGNIAFAVDVVYGFVFALVYWRIVKALYR